MIAMALCLGGQPAVAGRASAMFSVTMELLTQETGVGCRNSVGESIECSPRPVVSGGSGSDTRVILYGSSLVPEDGQMWGAVAASRRVTWAGRDYLELTLSW